MEPYRIILPTVPRIPILLSIPHCGTAFPDEIKSEYVSDLIESPDDTDWFVDRLYSFAPSLGIPVISGVWSRWVIDLNRHPESKPLYTDGRIITDLCPVTTFLGQPLYRNGRKHVKEEEVRRRTRLYFDPYHQKLAELLNDLKAEFGKVLLWDCHSIRQVVLTIQKDKFPDLILGSADAQSAHPVLIESALESLSRGGYTLQHNDPFKGGFITRHYGKPELRQHALQLEMSKINYMDDSEKHYHPERAKKMEELLHNTISGLSQRLISLKDQ
ncbi:MAG TPA: N-formylglutamate amidohydrolase [Chryseosolibacter sp.]